MGNKPTDIFTAVCNGDLEAVENINQQNEEGTPLLLASRNGHTHTVRFLLLKGASVVDAAARDGSTPIHAAATFGHTDTLRVLLDSGADIQSTDNAQNTALSGRSKQSH
ncbi:unnamed protein product [Clonostachys chloroleuca]|uniref:Uncharacterized protein n=1 Tax=Clonostachys chloroleuca TaxID=1926264 RepID=A0AA35MCT8_9HYPO|nr:unnamed protein product [Clonostachys chloroleuca]